MGNEDDDVGLGGFDEDFVNSAVYRELSAYERGRSSRRPRPPPPPPRGQARTKQRRQRRVIRRTRVHDRLQGARAWLIFAAIVAVIALVQLPGEGPDPGRTGLGGAPLQVARAGQPTPERAASTTPLGQPQPHPDVPGGYAFMVTQTDGDPVTYDPCRPIRYVVNDRTAPPGGDVLLHEAIATVSAVTGLRFEALGATDEPPVGDRQIYQPDRYGDRWAPILIAWSDAAEVPDLVTAAGIAGSTAYSSSELRSDVFVTGAVTLDGPAFTEMLTWPDGPAEARRVLLHELGHLLGLAHVADPGQIMSPGGPHTELQPGDLAGLSRLGAGPCFRML